MKLFLDACTIIYRLEQAIEFSGGINTLLRETQARHGALELVVSRLSWLECRVKPLRDGDLALLADYQRFFTAPGLTIVELAPAVIEWATSLRAHYKLRTPDALQAASCLYHQADLPFVTADPGFRRVPGLDVRLIRPESPDL